MTRIQTSRWLTIGLMLMLSVTGFRLPEVFGQKPQPKPEDTSTPTPPAQPDTKPSKQAPALDMEFVLIPAGKFQMGLTNGSDAEKPVHWVRISQPFYLGKYEVTQAEWKAVMGNNPSRFKGDNLPVESVSWDDCQAFIRKLNARRDGYTYRLPSEAEWEYAGRAGTAEDYEENLMAEDYEGNLGALAWYASNSDSQTHPVGRKSPNQWGLHDIQGNVWEWCQDWYHETYYQNSPGTDPEGPSTDSFRVVRGGSWGDIAPSCRSTLRSLNPPGVRLSNLGFRLVRIADR